MKYQVIPNAYELTYKVKVRWEPQIVNDFQIKSTRLELVWLINQNNSFWAKRRKLPRRALWKPSGNNQLTLYWQEKR